jgi:hypothetical protein
MPWSCRTLDDDNQYRTKVVSFIKYIEKKGWQRGSTIGYYVDKAEKEYRVDYKYYELKDLKEVNALCVAENAKQKAIKKLEKEAEDIRKKRDAFGKVFDIK